jgi:hypothetical protein
MGMVRRLHQETTMSLKWIAERLQMGSWAYVTNLLNDQPDNQMAQAVPPLNSETLACENTLF